MSRPTSIPCWSNWVDSMSKLGDSAMNCCRPQLNPFSYNRPWFATTPRIFLQELTRECNRWCSPEGIPPARGLRVSAPTSRKGKPCFSDSHLLHQMSTVKTHVSCVYLPLCTMLKSWRQKQQLSILSNSVPVGSVTAQPSFFSLCSPLRDNVTGQNKRETPSIQRDYPLWNYENSRP
ncbi:hypothetical protein B0H10DRAFT_14249 [Mycena sp. CBHHK59/15]|nr:hypothetical protein B0H10DRAFT_14249 [Mycena sp. CBHHK59/15]